MSLLTVLILIINTLALIALIAGLSNAFITLEKSGVPIWPGSTSEKIYEDEDGTATVESQEAYNVQVPKRSVLVLAVIAFCLATSLLVLDILARETPVLIGGRWISTIAWVSRWPYLNLPFQY